MGKRDCDGGGREGGGGSERSGHCQFCLVNHAREGEGGREGRRGGSGVRGRKGRGEAVETGGTQRVQGSRKSFEIAFMRTRGQG